MSPPQRNFSSQQDQVLAQQPPNQVPQQQPLVPYIPQNSAPSTPIPLYPTGAAALIPAPPTYEVIPNRIFVGGFPTSTTETDLREHFEKFYPVKDVKMVKSLDGQSKGYGFITFETEDQAETVRKLLPKQLEFRNRKLNLGPAIRKLGASSFPPGYAIASPGPLGNPSQSPFGYISASPSPFGYPVSQSPMFVYPPVLQNQEQNGLFVDQKLCTPQQSPNHQQPQQQVFFGAADHQEPARTYANAVSVFPGNVKSEPVDDHRSASPQQPQPLVNNNMMNIQYAPQQWPRVGNEQDPNNNNNNNYAMVYYDQHGGYIPMPHQMQYAQNGDCDKNGFQPPMYMSNNGMYQSYSYVQSPIPGIQYPPQLMRVPVPYWQMQQQPQKSYYGNNWNGQAEMHYQQQQPPQPNMYYQGYPGYQQQLQQSTGNDENSFVRPLQAPRSGKKSRKPSESHEKKNKSPVKGVRQEPFAGKEKNRSPEKTPKKEPNVSPLSSSLQSLAISSPTKNQ